MIGIDAIIIFFSNKDVQIPVFQNLIKFFMNIEWLQLILDLCFINFLNIIFDFIKEVHVFALEYKVGDGQRIYLVTTYAELWFYYKSR